MRTTLFFVCCCLISSWSATSAQDTAITYQGQLQQSGEPFTGTANLEFRLYSQLSGGSQVGPTQTRSSWPVEDGLFQVELDFGLSAFTEQVRYLQVRVNGTNLAPRQAIRPSPMALFALGGNEGPAGPAGPAGPPGASPFTLSSGNAVYTAGSVGVGTTSPVSPLHVSDAMSWEEGSLLRLSNSSDQGSSISLATGFQTWRVGQNRPGGTGPADAFFIYDESADSNRLLINTAGNVGIGTLSPVARLAVQPSGNFSWDQGNGRGDFAVSDGVYGFSVGVSTGGGGAGRVRLWSQGGQQSISLGTPDAGSVLNVLNNSRVGIHTFSPDGVLHVQQPASATNLATILATTSTSGGTIGVWGQTNTTTGTGVQGTATTTSGLNYGVLGVTSSSSGFGVFSEGRFGASGTKSFVIDHPFDPENQYLQHYSAEGPEPQNIYNGTVTLDGRGEAWVELPDYFIAINRDPRYQLTCIGGFAQIFVADEIDFQSDVSRFRIAGGRPGLKVSWEVKAVRDDPYVRTYGSPVEVVKPESKRGTFLHPELYGQPRERGQNFRPTGVSTNPELDSAKSTVGSPQS